MAIIEGNWLNVRTRKKNARNQRKKWRKINDIIRKRKKKRIRINGKEGSIRIWTIIKRIRKITKIIWRRNEIKIISLRTF